jgi:DNA-binding NarL/FixJ family response regulator
MTQPLRVVIADDEDLLRAGFGMILAADGMEIVGEAPDGLRAIDTVLATCPDIVLMDIRMPGLDGLEATRQIMARATTPPRVIVLTTFDLDRYVYAALRAGASGFLLKDVTPERLVASVRLVHSGSELLAPGITRRLIQRFTVAEAPAAPPHGDLAGLTGRELDVLRQLAQGLSNAELATRLQVSETTVKTHVGRILAKLHLRDRAQAIIVAFESGLVTPGAAEASPGV